MSVEYAQAQALLWADRTLRNLPPGDADGVQREVAAAESALQMLSQSEYAFPGAAETYRDYIRCLRSRVVMAAE